jgi:hypothetical protein
METTMTNKPTRFIDPDLKLVAGFLARTLSDKDRFRLDMRMATDLAFDRKAVRIMNGWRSLRDWSIGIGCILFFLLLSTQWVRRLI